MTNREIPNKKQVIKELFTAKKLTNTLLVMVAAGVFIGYLAPFGMDTVPLHISIGFWLVTCITGYFIYTPIIVYCDSVLQNKLATHWHRVALATIIASLMMALVVPVIIWLFFGTPIDIEQIINVFPKAIVIGGVITFVSLTRDLITEQKKQLADSKQKISEHQQAIEKTERESAKALMQQLPVEKRGELWCLEMSDHYLKVYTDQGHHLVLMRFKDALTNLADYPGLQTHRSWWVAHSAIMSVKKDNRKVSLVLKNSLEVPVSRTYVGAVKSAGFL